MSNEIIPDLGIHLQVDAEHMENGVRVIDLRRPSWACRSRGRFRRWSGKSR